MTLNWILDYRYRSFMVAGGLALLALPVIAYRSPDIAIEGPALLFFAGYLLLSWLRLRRLTPAYLKIHADAADAPALVIFAATALTIIAAIGSLFLALNRDAPSNVFELLLAFCSVLFGWLTIHTMAAMHYAHVFWKPMGKPVDGKRGYRGGLEFPGTPEPSGYDFVYFSFVIGMTAQTSDVQITTTAMRKLNLVHATVSYFFNTVLIAAAVNGAVSFAS
ncbi:DUF1345 domain-containing protein [Agrobacterium sp. a22-2]|uniref:DUF1345 domain-containing protein n=1 Tax=Agrobacterium sp. a22-2 TaxID=2283840 RepID=UPI001444F745|nr:DUF1345 domain-containing protein [Agrobacterium sp. a22-2]NKN36475.1 DUF1345 domain-containing protein [Agrobacterium sp. a22-2]